MVHESGQLLIWLTRQLEHPGLPIVCLDARLAYKALAATRASISIAMLDSRPATM
jgi:hypothetical protein